MADSESRLDLYRNDDAEISYKIRNIWFPVAIVVSILLLVVCIVFVILYSQAVNRPEVSPRGEAPKYEICDDESCFYLGLKVVNKMNKSVDPCQDFYAYACGGWQERHPLINNASISSTDLIAIDTNFWFIKKALEQAHVKYSKNVAVMKTVRVYNSCMNTTAVNALGLQPLKDLIVEYGGWTISLNYNSTVNIATRIGRAARDLDVNSLFHVKTTSDLYNSSINILTFSLWANKNLDPDTGSVKIREARKKYMKAVGKMFNSSDEKMMAIYDFEVKLAKISNGRDPDKELTEHLRRNIQTKANGNNGADDLIISLSSFCKSSGFSWSLLKEILTIVFGREFSGEEKVLALPATKNSFNALYSLYENTNESILADYVMWRVVNHYMDALPDRYRSAKFGNEIRWFHCLSKMLKPFDMTLGLLYVDGHFSDDSKRTMEEMVENIRSSFIERLQSQTWMDSKTRELAKQKALAIKADVGYPSFIKNPQKLEERYKSFDATDSLFANFRASNHLMRMRDVKSYGIPVDKNKWIYGSPTTYNAEYYIPFNRIVLFAGMIQPPMYSPGYPRYMAYGGIGMTVGHEITHGFDGTGRLYDKNGNLRNWWSESSASSFVDKSKCLKRQYNKYKVFNKYVNGKVTLDENIADNGGIKIAYDAYQRLTAKNGTDKILPGLNLNPNQLFFLGFAQGWCSIYGMEAAYEQLKTDDHTFDKYRVIGSLSNFKKFSEAFNCPTNSRMNPSDKCAIW